VDDRRFARVVDGHRNGIALRYGLVPGVLSRDLPTPDGRVQVFSPQLQAELRRLQEYVEPDLEWPLRLIGRREKGSQNSWMHNASRVYPDS
jgi:formate dehydrogenase